MIVPCPRCATANRLPAARLGERAKCAACKEPLVPLAKPVALASAGDFDELVRDAKVPVLVDYWASWCGPCRALAPELERLARETEGRLVVAKLDTESLPEVAARFGIQSIPTMILFRGGREAKRLSGARPAPAILAELGL